MGNCTKTQTRDEHHQLPAVTPLHVVELRSGNAKHPGPKAGVTAEQAAGITRAAGVMMTLAAAVTPAAGGSVIKQGPRLYSVKVAAMMNRMTFVSLVYRPQNVSLPGDEGTGCVTRILGRGRCRFVNEDGGPSSALRLGLATFTCLQH